METSIADIKFIDENKVEIVAVKHVKKTTDVPKWLLNFMMKKMGAKLIAKLEKAIKLMNIDKIKNDENFKTTFDWINEKYQ